MGQHHHHHHLTLKDVKARLRPLGVTCNRTGWDRELRVALAGARGGEGYHTDDLADALDTGLHMAAEALRRQHQLAATAVTGRAGS